MNGEGGGGVRTQRSPCTCALECKGPSGRVGGDATSEISLHSFSTGVPHLKDLLALVFYKDTSPHRSPGTRSLQG